MFGIKSIIFRDQQPELSPLIASGEEPSDSTNLSPLNDPSNESDLPFAISDSNGSTNWGILVIRDKTRRIQYLSAKLPSDIAKVSHVIYEIFDKQKSYFGKTEQPAGQRITQHLSESLKLRDRANIHLALNENPDNFRIRIYPVSSDQDLVSIEKRFIASKPLSELYNENKGGAGGIAREISKKKAEPQTPPKSNSNSPSSSSSPRLTPTKYYPYRKDQGKFIVTPEGRKKQGPLVYVIKDAKADNQEGKRYYGKTSTTFAKRVYNHNAAIRKAFKENEDQLQNLPDIHSAIAASNLTTSPPRFSIGIVRTLSPTKDPGTLEAELIKTRDTLAPNGYNQRSGGGGPNGTKLSFDKQ